MSAYYGVHRSNDYLMHFGVKGMHWHNKKAYKNFKPANGSAGYKAAFVEFETSDGTAANGGSDNETEELNTVRSSLSDAEQDTTEVLNSLEFPNNASNNEIVKHQAIIRKLKRAIRNYRKQIKAIDDQIDAKK